MAIGYGGNREIGADGILDSIQIYTLWKDIIRWILGGLEGETDGLATKRWLERGDHLMSFRRSQW